MRLMSTRGRQMATSVFYEPNQLKPRTCFYNRPFHVLLSSDENTKLALRQVSKQWQISFVLPGLFNLHIILNSLHDFFCLISLSYRER
jgi:hypothetical protein